MKKDSGFSGGDMQRPALRWFLDDMQSDTVDVAVVREQASLVLCARHAI